MHKKVIYSLIMLLLLLGISLFSYPTISNWLAIRRQDQTINRYEESIYGLNQEEISTLWQQAQEHNFNRVKFIFGDPFSLANDPSLEEEYSSIINIDGIMGYIEIPAVNIHLPIRHGVNEFAISKGVGHLPYSGIPIGGKGNHAVLTSHSALSSAKLFTDLEKVGIGDMFYIHILGNTLIYEIDQIITVLPDNINALAPINDEDYVTLITCTPYAINSHRLLVRGKRIFLTKEEITVYNKNNYNSINWLLIILFITLIIGIISLIFKFKIKSRKQ
jgi:LPXTG-site transpeptidase (sortase) family protein